MKTKKAVTEHHHFAHKLVLDSSETLLVPLRTTAYDLINLSSSAVFHDLLLTWGKQHKVAVYERIHYLLSLSRITSQPFWRSLQRALNLDLAASRVPAVPQHFSARFWPQWPANRGNNMGSSVMTLKLHSASNGYELKFHESFPQIAQVNLTWFSGSLGPHPVTFPI